ncbi:MAG TPA: SPOR domain-containing protein [Thermodesulfovibrionales bacterium]|nr:SPOR domain-containing protein [Thermodesulfovibrionales bacterium]
MKKDGAHFAELLPRKVVLIAIAVITVSLGFAVGYVVGRSVSSPGTFWLRQPAGGDVATVPVAPYPSDLKNEISSSPAQQPQPSSLGDRQASAPSSPYGAIPSAADVRNEEKTSPKSQKAALTEKGAASGSGERSVTPAMALNQDKGGKNAADALDTEKIISTQTVGSSDKRTVYTVQAAAFKHQEDAYALSQMLEGKGYKASVKKDANPKGGVLFKVRIGEFEQKKDASVLALKLKKMDGLNAFPVVKN